MSINPESTANKAHHDLLHPAAWGVTFILIVAVIQLFIAYPLDDDTAYHFSVARLIREQGILYNFPWTRFSWQYDHYADKEFLFHLLFVPFTPLGFDAASRIVGVIAGAGVLTVAFLVLRAEKVRYAGIWAILPLGTTIFLYRFSQVRPHLLSIALAITFLWAYSRRRHVFLALAAFLYPLFYVAFWQIPLLLIVAAEGGRLLSGEKKFCWQLPLIVATGLAGGLALHPNGFNLLQINWIHMADILFRNAWGNHVEFNMGEEFEPFSFLQWLEYLLPTAVMTAVAARYSWPQRKAGAGETAFVLATIIFCLLTMRTNRFLEYAVPFSVLSLALTTGRYGKKWLLPLLVSVLLIYTLATGLPLLKYLGSHDERTWQMNPRVVAQIDGLLPKDADVFTCGWEYTGSLLLNLPDRDYMVALDPTLLYKRYPEMYELWYRTMTDAPPSAADIVRRNFASRFVVCLDHPTLHPFFDALATDRGTRVLYSDGKWVLFDLGSGSGTAQ